MDKLPHESNGEACCVAHFDAKMNALPSCLRCKHCNEWVRPENMNDPCPALYPPLNTVGLPSREEAR